jgi:hypothetical protein
MHASNMYVAVTGVAFAVATASWQVTSEPQTARTADRASLSERIDGVIAKVKARKLRSDQQTPWVIMHAAIAFKSGATVYDAESGEEVEAIDFLLTRAKYENELMFRVVDGTPTLPRVPAVEHHADQYLMMLALADISQRRMLRAGPGERYRVADLIEAAKLGFQDDQEVGWTLVALSTYLSFDDKWRAANGQMYEIADILARGIEKDPRQEAEGGTHHLFGVSYAYRKHARDHVELNGVWRDAKMYLDGHVQTVRRFQLDDGAFSAGLLKEQKYPKSPSDLVFSTGHTLEWLAFALSKKELAKPWVERAVQRICQEIELHPLDAFSDGGIYHAVNALRLYQQMVLRDQPQRSELGHLLPLRRSPSNKAPQLPGHA